MTPGYPPARRLDLVENVAGHQVADPYRWLEDPGSDESRAWLAAQDALAREHLTGLPLRPALAARIAELTATGYVSAPRWRGERCFFLRRDPDQEHPVLITSGPGEPDRALVDPGALDPSGATTLDAWTPDHDGRLLAYQLSHGGDEESELRVLDVVTGEQVEGPIDRCRYTMVAWLPGGKAYYYVRRLDPASVPAGEAQYHRRVYLHTVGTPPEADTLIFGEGRDKTDYYGVSISWDGRWLVISAAQGTSPRTDVWLADLAASSPAAPALHVVQEGTDARTGAHVGRDGRLYVFTDAGAPRGRLAVADPARPGPDGWQDLIGEDPEAVLTGYAILDGGGVQPPVLLAAWTRHAMSEITVHDLATGERRGMVGLPGPGVAGGGHLGTAGQLTERPEGGHEAWFGYTDHITPVTIHRYDARTAEVTPWARAPGSVTIPQVAISQVTYASADGTEVRMLVLSPDTDPAGPARNRRPAILYGYGGFGISLLTPAYSAAALAWVEAGGVYAIAGAARRRRGGRGVAPRRDARAQAERVRRLPRGRRPARRRRLDHPRAARHLRRLERRPARRCGAHPAAGPVPRWSAPRRCSTWSATSGSGSARPGTTSTAPPPTRRSWAGCSSYSPYHHVRAGVRYPAVLFTVFDSDTRVDPMHARKMCAALQHATSARLPDARSCSGASREVGHGARAVSRSVSLSADTLAFLRPPHRAGPAHRAHQPGCLTPGGSSAGERLPVVTDGRDLAVRRPPLSPSDRAVRSMISGRCSRDGQQGVPAQPQRLLRLVRLQPAAGLAKVDQRPVEDLIGRVQTQRQLERVVRAPVVAQHDQGVPLVEQQLALGVPERGVAPLGRWQPGQRLVCLVQQGCDRGAAPRRRQRPPAGRPPMPARVPPRRVPSPRPRTGCGRPGPPRPGPAALASVGSP